MNKTPQLFPVGKAAKMLGIHPQTLRRLTIDGRITCSFLKTVSGRLDRRYSQAEIDRLTQELYLKKPKSQRRAVLYLRVAGQTGQEPSLTSQEAELRAACAVAGVEVVAVFKDCASGLNERRVGLLKALKALSTGDATEIRVTHADRLGRFGVDWLRTLIESYGASLIILHPKETVAPEEELLADFMALIASFSGRVYGQRSAALRRKLLTVARARIDQEPAQSIELLSL